MEEIATNVESHLIDSLSFKLKPGAEYVTSRRSVTFHPQGGNEYSPAGVTLVRISMTGSQGEWLDPSTLAIQFDINNDSPGPAQLLHFYQVHGHALGD